MLSAVRLKFSFLPSATKLWQGNVFTGVCDSIHWGNGGLCQGDAPWPESPQTETPLTETPWTERPPTQRPPAQRPPAQRPPGQKPPAQRPHWTETPLDRDPTGLGRDPWAETPRERPLDRDS